MRFHDTLDVVFITEMAVEDFDEIIEEFLVESYESLDMLDQDLVALEDAPKDRDRLASVFRTIHTIKGTSGFLAFPNLEKVAHVGENLLVPLRDGELDLTREIADSLLSMVDAIREILHGIETTGQEGTKGYDDLVERLGSLLNGRATDELELPSNSPASVDIEAATNVVDSRPPESISETSNGMEQAAGSELNRPMFDESAEIASSNGELELPVATSHQPDRAVDKPEPVAAIADMSVANSDAGDRSHSVADSTVRINVELLDKLMNLVGELVLSRNQVMQYSENCNDPALSIASQRLNLITSELQEGVMKTRMQPIRNAWSKLPRVVRDLSASCGKDVDVQMEGADTELDKTILEALKDPLTHIVRNSVDHGIETEEVRCANGKPAKGLLCLRAFHEGGQVNIEIADDGGGINADRIRAKAIEKGLITEAQASTMSERELTNLILLPGFSTAAQVTNVSGRGVGMDVVKTNIERIGGTLDISSVPSAGTTLRIKIPLTLAIVPALIVKSGEGQYAIPQVSLLELVRLDGNRGREQIEYIHETPVYRLRGNLLPLVYLDEQLGLRPKRRPDEQSGHANIVVLQAEDQPFGLVVDSISDTQEIVVKPLGAHLKDIACYAGATIMGDGAVALILDVFGLAHRSHVLTKHRDRAIQNGAAVENLFDQDVQALLLVDPGDQTRAAIELSSIARLEEFDPSMVERTGNNDVVQYRNEIMPLIYLPGYAAPTGPHRLNTLVYSLGDVCVGVVVGKIMDIVHERGQTKSGEQQKRRVIQDRVTEIIDLNTVVRSRFPEFVTSV